MDTVSTSKLCCLLTFEGKEGRMKKEEEEFALVFHGGGVDRETAFSMRRKHHAKDESNRHFYHNPKVNVFCNVNWVTQLSISDFDPNYFVSSRKMG